MPILRPMKTFLMSRRCSSRQSATSLAWVILASSVAAQTGVSSTKEANKRIQHLPYFAQTRFVTTVDKLADGTTRTTTTHGSQARDSEGRTLTAGERTWTYLEHGKPMVGREMLYRVEDPVSNTETRWDSSSKEAKLIHLPKPDRTPSSDCACVPDPSYDSVQKLGTRVIAGVLAEGTRSTYTVSSEQSSSGKPLTVVHETWYSPELKIMVLETNDDPRDGTTRSELDGIVRGEPDASKFRPPSDYVIHEIWMPGRQR